MVMSSKNALNCAFDELIQLANQKGYLLFDDIDDASDRWNLSIVDIDRLSSSITMRGIIIYDEIPVIEDENANDYDDYAQIDYEQVYRKVVSIDPGLEGFINSVRQIVPPQAKEMNQLKYLVAEGNYYARERVIQMYLRVVVRIALKRVEIYDLDMADTLQDGCIGLINAVDKYDPDSGIPFGSYASFWIFQNITRDQQTKRPLIYYPYKQKAFYYIAYPVLKKYGCLDCSNLLHCHKAIKILEKTPGIPRKDISDSILQSIPLNSLEAINSHFLKEVELIENQNDVIPEDFFNLADVLYDNYCLNDEVDEIWNRTRLHEILKNELTPKEYQVISERYGLNKSDTEKTLNEVGESLGVSRERIRQIENKAFKKLNSTLTKVFKELIINRVKPIRKGKGRGNRDKTNERKLVINEQRPVINVKSSIPNGIYTMRVVEAGVGEISGTMEVQGNGKFIVKRGSHCLPIIDEYSIPEIRKMAIVKDNILQEDLECSSPSIAACIVRGHKSNGWADWLDKNGIPIAQYKIINS